MHIHPSKLMDLASVPSFCPRHSLCLLLPLCVCLWALCARW